MDLGESVGTPDRHRNLTQDAPTIDVAPEVQHGIDPGQELAVGRVALQPRGEGQRLYPGRNVACGVGVEGAAPALVAGVEGC